MKNIQSISSLLFTFCGILLLSTVFMTDTELEDGIVIGKVHWFHQVMIFLSICCFIILIKSRKFITISFSDVLVLLLAIVVVLTYDWQLNPAPEKILFGTQLVILWFLLRFIFNGWAKLKLVFIIIIIITGVIEALLGIAQLHGLLESNHTLFNLTGHFYNPGPYSGYLALILPICLWVIFNFKKDNKWLMGLAGVCLFSILVVLPAGMSRTAWLSAVFSSGWVCWMQFLGIKKTKNIIKNNRILSIISAISLFALLCYSLNGIYRLKEDSANGRFYLWKVTSMAFLEQPFTGTGVGGFRVAYANTQAKYFSSVEAKKSEKILADCPHYSFNEFLQLGLELGVIGLSLFVTLLVYSLSQGIKNRHIGVVGGLLSLIIFSFASYPLQLPEFWVVFIVLLVIANSEVSIDLPKFKILNENKSTFVIIGGLTLCSVFIFYQQEKYIIGYEKWHTAKILYNYKVYNAAQEEYKNLATLLKHRSELLFEIALCFNREKQYEKANDLLYQAMKLSSDPMIYYVAAQNEQQMGNYTEAEKLLLHIIKILPVRIYPYYLLAKLYLEPTFFHENKFINAASVVLYEKPKVYNDAIWKMRKEIGEFILK